MGALGAVLGGLTTVVEAPCYVTADRLADRLLQRGDQGPLHVLFWGLQLFVEPAIAR